MQDSMPSLSMASEPRKQAEHELAVRGACDTKEAVLALDRYSTLGVINIRYSINEYSARAQFS